MCACGTSGHTHLLIYFFEGQMRNKTVCLHSGNWSINPSSEFDEDNFMIWLLVGFVALRPKSTAMVIAGQSVHLTTLFPGQA